MNARLIGINSAIYSQSGGSIGIGFAIPVNMVKIVVAAAKAASASAPPWSGRRCRSCRATLPIILGSIGRRGAGRQCHGEDPAAEAGLKRSDIITASTGSRSTTRRLRLSLRHQGDRASPRSPPSGRASRSSCRSSSPMLRRRRRAIGQAEEQVAVFRRHGRQLSPAVAEEYSIEVVHEGVVVTDVEDGSNAAIRGLKKAT